MHDTQSLLTIILESIFVGFGIVIPIFSLIRTSNLKAIEVKDIFVLTGVQMVRVAGLLYFVLWCVSSYLNYNPYFAQTDGAFFTDRNFWVLWYSPIMYLILSQIFWIKKMYMKKPALITLALLLFILPSRRIMLLLVQFDSKYLPDSAEAGILLLKFLLNSIIFIFIAFAVILAGGKLKKKP